jgi:5-methylcytosine-specific restriction endonuclease McrA
MGRNYDDPVYKETRKRVLKRDKRKCQMPKGGKICGSRRRPQVHHIKTWAKATHLRYEERNLIVLCSSCHNDISGKEHHYVPLLEDIVRRKYG